MCDECVEHEVLNLSYRLSRTKSIYHCLSGPARCGNGLFNNTDEWYINGKYIPVSSQKEFEKSKEYREWKLKAFK